MPSTVTISPDEVVVIGSGSLFVVKDRCWKWHRFKGALPAMSLSRVARGPSVA